MKHIPLLIGGVMAAMALALTQLGYDQTFVIAFGAMAFMALAIAVTFLWLWRIRATPLALGMAFSWAGAGGVLGWWWMYRLLDRPPFMADNPVLLVLLSLYIVGAMLHFAVIQTSFHIRPGLWIAGVLGAFAVSGAFSLL